MDKTIRRLVKRFDTNDPFRIARGLNIHIRYADLDTSTRGLYYRALRRRFIVLNSNTTVFWQRFICAHELGHDRLHPGISRFWLDEHSFFSAGKLERQANQFAVRLLTALDKQGHGESVEQLLRRNGVPIEMAQYYR